MTPNVLIGGTGKIKCHLLRWGKLQAETSLWTYSPHFEISSRLPGGTVREAERAVCMEFKFECHLFIDVFKALKVDESTQKVSVKIRGPGALQY